MAFMREKCADTEKWRNSWNAYSPPMEMYLATPIILFILIVRFDDDDDDYYYYFSGGGDDDDSADGCANIVLKYFCHSSSKSCCISSRLSLAK